MKHNIRWMFIAAGVGLLVGMGNPFSDSISAAETDTGGASYESQKATALANPYANDSGPTSIDVSSYPPEIQETYKKFLQTPNFGCQRCHTASRPLNSQYLEPS